jgi:ABC-type branched-subunit amino acid transport system substrate-binding protein
MTSPAASRRPPLLALALPLMLSACGGEGGGAAATPGVSGDTISLGALTPLSDAVAVIGKPMLAGMTMYFDRVNAESGGIGGRYPVRIIAEDVTYVNPSTSTQKYQKIKDQVAMIGLVVGTDHVNGLLPLLAEDSVVASPTTFDAEWVRDPNLMPWGLPYQLQAINGVSYFREKFGADRKVCTLVLATGYGEAAEEGVEYLAREAGFTVAARARFRQDDQDFVAPVTQLKNAGCQGVMLASLPSVTGKVLGAAAQLGFTPQWIATSPSWHQALVASPIRDYLVKHYWHSWDGPAYGDTSVVGVRRMFETMAKYAPQQQPDFYLFAGYLQASHVHRLLEEAVRRGDLSRGGIRQALMSLGTVGTEGLLGDYTYGAVETRGPTRAGAIFRVDPAGMLGLVLERSGVTSEAAQRYEFPAHTR